VRNLSFFLTQEQFRDRSKTVTRRLGWKTLQRGTLLCAVVKSQGLKPGEKIQRLGTIRVVAVNSEPLNLLELVLDCEDTNDKPDTWGADECAREGFPELSPAEFVAMFCRHMKCETDQLVTRIEFEYVDPPTGG